MRSAKLSNPTAVSRLLTSGRLRIYPLILISAFVVLTAAWILRASDLIDPSGQVLGADFMAFWSASELASEGRFVDAYDPEQLFEASKRAVPNNESRFIFSYPPIYGLFIAPLAQLAYPMAWLLWSLTGLAVFVVVLAMLTPAPFRLWLTLAFPGVYLNIIQGQNGLFSAALLGGAMMSLASRPILAGVLIGLLTVKPTLGLLLPLALLCARQWVAFFAAAATTLALALTSVLVFGMEPWIAFIGNAGFASAMLEQGQLPWAKMPSVFVALRMLDVGTAVAYAAQGVVAVAVVIAVARGWWNWRDNPQLAAAMLVAGALLMTPHLNNHDLAVLAIPLAILIADAGRRPWSGWEQALLGFAWLAPLVMAPLADFSHVQIGLLAPAATFAIAARRFAEARVSFSAINTAV